MKINYQFELEKELELILKRERVPRLLLHACCAPCSSYVLEYLTGYFNITLYFYNPNITDPAEYQKRADELKRFIEIFPHENPINAMICPMAAESFYEASAGLEILSEGGERCFKCYRLRLEGTAKYMAEHKDEYDYFATTLTVSPHKNARKLNEIGIELSKIYDVTYLPSDFKKREGYKRSIEMSREYGLYRQNFCGCEFSRKARDLTDGEL